MQKLSDINSSTANNIDQIWELKKVRLKSQKMSLQKT